jgi:hypothetical protein
MGLQSTIIWKVPPTTIRDRLNRILGRSRNNWEKISNDISKEIGQHMVTTHPFKNITFGAEESLFSRVEHTKDAHIFTFGFEGLAERSQQRYGRYRDYSIYLETMQAGRFAIVQPTHEMYKRIILARFKGSLVGD